MTGGPPRPERPTSSGLTTDIDGSRERLRHVAMAALAITLAVQLVVVYAPTAPGGPEINGLDKVIHLVVFAAPTMAGLLAGLPLRWVVAAMVLHAPLSEVLQALLLPHRDGSLLDAVADITGVILALGVFMAGRRRRRW